MTNGELRAAAKLMVSVADGNVKRVDVRPRVEQGVPWHACESPDHTYPMWDWYRYEYRAAPEPLLRTYTDSEVVGLVGKEVAETLDGFVFVVAGVDVRRASQPMVLLEPIRECWTERRISVEVLLQRYNFLDGSPCGVEVEE